MLRGVPVSTKTHAQIVDILMTEALDQPEVGWLSDIPYRLEDQGDAIGVFNGSIDVSHLASIVLEILEGNR